MDLITKPTSLTEEQQFEMFLNRLQQNIDILYSSIKSKHTVIFDQIFYSKFPTQMIVSALGKDKTVLLLQLSQTIEQILKTADSEYKLLDSGKDIEITETAVIVKDKIASNE